MLFPPAQAPPTSTEEFYHAQERTTTVRQAKALSTHAGHFCISLFYFLPLGSCLLKGCLKNFTRCCISRPLANPSILPESRRGRRFGGRCNAAVCSGRPPLKSSEGISSDSFSFTLIISLSSLFLSPPLVRNFSFGIKCNLARADCDREGRRAGQIGSIRKC